MAQPRTTLYDQKETLRLIYEWQLQTVDNISILAIADKRRLRYGMRTRGHDPAALVAPEYGGANLGTVSVTQVLMADSKRKFRHLLGERMVQQGVTGEAATAYLESQGVTEPPGLPSWEAQPSALAQPP